MKTKEEKIKTLFRPYKTYTVGALREALAKFDPDLEVVVFPGEAIVNIMQSRFLRDPDVERVDLHTSPIKLKENDPTFGKPIWNVG